jgi:hypothetical protein
MARIVTLPLHFITKWNERNLVITKSESCGAWREAGTSIPIFYMDVNFEGLGVPRKPSDFFIISIKTSGC